MLESVRVSGKKLLRFNTSYPISDFINDSPTRDAIGVTTSIKIN